MDIMQINNALKEYEKTVWEISNNLVKCGWVTSENAPDTFSEVVKSYKDNNKIVVWNGASEHTIFENPISNFAFRAWHDYRHITHTGEFSFAGEVAVFDAQAADVRTVCGDSEQGNRIIDILRIEIIGQAQHFADTGAYVIKQKQFLIDSLTGVL